MPDRDNLIGVPRPSETELIAQFFAPFAAPEGLGLSDDAACLRPRPGHDLVLTADALMEGVHFLPGDPPGSIARKALGVNVSDLAAKGAVPVGFLLTLALPDGWSAEWLGGFAEGLHRAASDWGCPLFGGDTIRSAGTLTLSITAIGEVPLGGMRRRDAAQPGDVIFVSGTIGDAVMGLESFRAAMSGSGDPSWLSALAPAEVAFIRDRYRHPVPRLSLTPVLRTFANAAMDISDGLVGDLMKLLGASKLGGEVDLGKIPLSESGHKAVFAAPELFFSLISGGDDYEILFTAPLEKAGAIEKMALTQGVYVIPIGVVSHGEGPPVFRRNGSIVTIGRKSFSHF